MDNKRTWFTIESQSISLISSIKDFISDLFRKNPGAVISISFFILLIVLRYITGFNGLYGQDSHEYLHSSKEIINLFKTGNLPDFYYPSGYPLAGAILSYLTFNPAAALQLISMISFSMVLFYTIKLLKLFSTDNKNELILYMVLCISLSPLFFKSAFLVMSDVTALFFTIAAFYHILKYGEERGEKDFLLSITFICVSVLTRYAAGVILFIPAFYLLMIFIYPHNVENKYQKKLNLKSPYFWIVMTGIFVLLFFHIVTHQKYLLFRETWLSGWNPKNFFNSVFATINGTEKYSTINLVYIFSNFYHPALMFMGVVLLFFIRMDDLKGKKTLLILLSLSFYFLFLSGIPYQNLRFLILSLPFVAILLFPAFKRFNKLISVKKIYLALFIIAILIIQSGLIYKYSFETLKLNRLENNISEYLKNNVTGERPIYTFYLNGALEMYGVRNPIINLFHERITGVMPGSLVLFNEDKFREQWKNENPMLNWNYIKSNYQLKDLKTFSGDWELYEIKK